MRLRAVSVGAAGVIAVALITGACSRKEKERADGKMAADALRAARSRTADAGPAPEVRVTLLFDEASGSPSGIEFVSDREAAEGLHVRLALDDGDGGVLAGEKLVAFCVARAEKDVPLRVPLDPSTDEAGKNALKNTRQVRVVSAAVSPGCLRPTLRVETLQQPREQLDGAVR